MRSSRRFCRLRAMNSSRALVTAAFFVRSPLTSSARSSKSGSIERFVAMCESPHIWLHILYLNCNDPTAIIPRLSSMWRMEAGVEGETLLRSKGIVTARNGGIEDHVPAASRHRAGNEHKGVPSEQGVAESALAGTRGSRPQPIGI